MSSYLTFYLLPKKSKKQYIYNETDGSTEKEVKITEGLPLAFLSYSRSSDIYQEFNENMSIAYAGQEDKYTEISHSDVLRICEDIEETIKKTKERLEIDYKIIKESGCDSDMWEQIHSSETFIKEQEETLRDIKNIANIVYEVTSGYNDFEKVLANVD